MLHIGKTYLEHTDGQARLCADVSLNAKAQTLWFGVDESQTEYLCPERSDAFVMALLPAAMTAGEDICVETPMSERLHYQLENYLIPILSMEAKQYHEITLQGPMTAEPVESMGGVGLYGFVRENIRKIIESHSNGSEYPLTHLILPDGLSEEETGLAAVKLTSNMSEVLGAETSSVFTYRRLAEAMALQGLLSMYLLPADRGLDAFSFAAENSRGYDFLTVHCAQTETLRVYLPGIQS